MEKLEMLYEGKAKQIYRTNKEDEVIVYYKDDATAFNGEKKGQIHDKGVMNNNITSILFEQLEAQGIKTHFIKKLNDREQLCKKVEIIPLEVIVRNVAAGSMAKRLGLEEGTALKTTVFEFSYKDDELGDPLINSYHAVAKENINLIDFKIEFGKTADGEIVLADEISPDTCRFWDATTGEKLDKDRFRRDLGNVEDAYIEILKRISK